MINKKEKRTGDTLLLYAMNISLFVGFFMLATKVASYWITGSSSILSDALESVVHVFAVGFAAYSLRFAMKGISSEYPYGHAKISFFSAAFEGGLIIFAALLILYDAVYKFIYGITLSNLSIGIILVVVALIVNGVLGIYLISVGKRENSLILVANGKHVLTDAWTSVGAVVGVGLVIWTDWVYWDPICAVIVALNILYSGAGLIKEGYAGLMDSSDPEVQEKLEKILKKECAELNIKYHELKNRNLGDSYWVDLHLLFDDKVSIKEAHHIATEIERKLEAELDNKATVNTHLEPREDHSRIHEAGH